MLNQSLQEKLPDVIKMLKKHRVRSAYAFGSVTNEKFNRESDIDLLISFEDKMDPLEYGDHFFSLYEELPILLNRKVDLVTEASLKNPFLIESVMENRIPLYE
jgi:predicted nucleotidyltransferase